MDVRYHEVAANCAASGMSLQRAVAMGLVLVAPKGLYDFRFVDLGDGNGFPRAEFELAVNNVVMSTCPIVGVRKAKGGFERARTG